MYFMMALVAQCLSVVSNTNCYTAITPECNSAIEKFQRRYKFKMERRGGNPQNSKISPMILTNGSNSINIAKVEELETIYNLSLH